MPAFKFSHRLFFICSFLLLLNSSLFATGVLDKSFGNNGVATLTWGHAQPTAIVVQPDKKIVVAGQSIGCCATVARFNEDGSPDTAFGVKVLWTGFVASLKLQPDGKILVSGSDQGVPETLNYASTIARLNSDGSIDTSFGNMSGRYRINRYPSNESIPDFTVLPDGKILGILEGGNTGVELLRLNADGLPDTTFGNQGFLLMNSIFVLPKIIPAANNKYLIASGGRATDNSSDLVRIIRINSDAVIDSSFGGNGLVEFAGTFGEAAVQPDGKFIVTGNLTRRFTSEGAIDPTFRIARTGYAIALFPDGRFVTSGDDSRNSTQNRRDTLQLQSNRNDLIGNANRPNSNASFGDLAVTDDGKILALYDSSIIRYSAITSFANPQADLDGDEKADISVYRPSAQTFFFLKSQDGYQFYTAPKPVGVILPENFTGDLRSDVAWWTISASQGCYYGFYSSLYQPYDCYQWGLSSDIPLGGDYDGDNKTDFAIYRNGFWHILQSSTNTSLYFNWGTNGDKPVPADYDGDGKTDAAIYRPSTGTWWVLRSSDSTYRAFQFGLSDDKPVPADYDGDGRADYAVYRPSNGVWYLYQSTNGFAAVQFGISTDRPVPADYDGDGRTDIAVFRPSEGNWYLLQSTNGFAAIHWGQSGDIPLTTAYSAY